MSTEQSPKDVGQGSETAPRMGKSGYGIDDPRTVIELGVAGFLSVLIGIVISAYTSASDPRAAGTALIVGPGVGFLILVVAAALFWSSRLGKVREMTKLVNNIPWGGDEVVLDLGCGRGLATVLAAKRLQAGFAISVDTWSKSRVSGNSPYSLYANAAQAGVVTKVNAVKGFSGQLPLPDRSVDVILSGVAVHYLVPRKRREFLFSEMARVLRDGGRVGILDQGNGEEYASLLKRTGLRDVHTYRLRFSSFPPFHVVQARKPYPG